MCCFRCDNVLRGFLTLHTLNLGTVALKNITVDTGTTKFNTAIEYDTDANNTAYSRVKHYINNGEAYSYTYDEAGNISKIQNPDGSYVEYTYDFLNQLTAEHYSACLPLSGEVDSAQAEAGGVVSYDTIEYTYDIRGNILQKTYSLDNTVVDTINYGYTDPTYIQKRRSR